MVAPHSACCAVDRPRGQHARWDKTVTERYTLCDPTTVRSREESDSRREKADSGCRAGVGCEGVFHGDNSVGRWEVLHRMVVTPAQQHECA